MVGRSGSMLQGILNYANVSMDEIHICNVCGCRTPDNRTPTIVETTACRPRLMQQLMIVDPVMVIAAGATAAAAMLGVKSVAITKERGKIYECRFESPIGDYTLPVYLVLHPANLLRNPDRNIGGVLWQTRKDFIEAFEIVDQYLEETRGVPPKDRRREMKNEQSDRPSS